LDGIYGRSIEQPSGSTVKHEIQETPKELRETFSSGITLEETGIYVALV